MNELQLFTYLKSRYIADLMMTNDEFETYDCSSEDLGVHIELKSRQTHYDELMIERDKYHAVTQRAWVNGKTALYICSTPKGIWSFNLNKLTMPAWYYFDGLPATTEFGNTDTITKVVGFLHIGRGKRIGAYGAKNA
jgi:hypothetical protein